MIILFKHRQRLHLGFGIEVNGFIYMTTQLFIGLIIKAK